MNAAQMAAIEEAHMRLLLVVRSAGYFTEQIVPEVRRRSEHIAAIWLTTPLKPPRDSSPQLAAIESVYHDVCRGVL